MDPVYQVLIYNQAELADADHEVATNHATTPNPVFSTPLRAIPFIREQLNQRREDAGLQLKYINVPDFRGHTGEQGDVWEYTDDDTGITAQIHETQVQ